MSLGAKQYKIIFLLVGKLHYKLIISTCYFPTSDKIGETVIGVPMYAYVSYLMLLICSERSS